VKVNPVEEPKRQAGRTGGEREKDRETALALLVTKKNEKAALN